jgi:GxxExxY protein
VEPIYQRAMEVALQHRDISFQRQKEVELFFEGEYLGFHKLDLVVADEIILELKAVKAFEDIHYAQLRSYLKAMNRQVGLLLNFSASTLVIKRVVLSS